MKSKHAFEMIKQSLTDAVANLEKEINEDQVAASGAGEKLGKAQGDLQTTTESKKADEEYLSKLITECKSKSAEWEERQKSATEEMKALEQGLAVLQGKFG